MGFDDICHTGLVLGISKQGLDNNNNNNQKPKKPISSNFEPSLTLSLSGEPTSYQVISSTKIGRVNYEVCHDKKTNNSDLFRQAYSPHSAVSSFSSGRVVKRERDITCDQEAEVEKVISSRASDEEDEDGPNSRKKLRLTKQQSSFLEESFKQHTTLNPVIS